MNGREQTRHKHLRSVPAPGQGTAGSWAAVTRPEPAAMPQVIEEQDRRVHTETVEVVPDERFAVTVDNLPLVPRVIEAKISYGRLHSVSVSDGRRTHAWTGLDMIAAGEGKPEMPEWVTPVLWRKGVDVETELDRLHAETGNALDELLLADRYPVQPADAKRGEAYDFFEYRSYHKTRAGSLKVRHGMVTGYWANPQTGEEEPVLFETLPGARSEFTQDERDEFMLRTRKQIALMQVRSQTRA
ncbi:hypothetical protein [Aeromicrobium sp. 179-A 4D2 NHS]|uniref:hypothetical protein n=1 Tax=Aeromicrobium sp. 179-A 4D2 NHS TaxID=3142375 RepID=UPI0039A22CA8